MALGQSARSGRLRAFVGNEQYDLLFLVVGCSRNVPSTLCFAGIVTLLSGQGLSWSRRHARCGSFTNSLLVSMLVWKFIQLLNSSDKETWTAREITHRHGQCLRDESKLSHQVSSDIHSETTLYSKRSCLCRCAGLLRAYLFCRFFILGASGKGGDTAGRMGCHEIFKKSLPIKRRYPSHLSRKIIILVVWVLWVVEIRSSIAFSPQDGLLPDINGVKTY